jgi:hypothetical protein
MLAAVLRLPIMLMIATAYWAGSARGEGLSCVPPGQQDMPNLRMSVQRTNPRVIATGNVIKGIYYSRASIGPYDAVAFYLACDRHLEPLPFLVADFDRGRFFLDTDRDGCADASGSFTSEIDPAEFSSPISDAEELCYGVPVSANDRWRVRSVVP